MTNFGWSLPPGVSLRDIEEQMGDNECPSVITPEQQIANLLSALQDTAEEKQHNGQLREIRLQIAYLRHQFAKFQAGTLEPLPTEGDPFVEF